MLKQCQSCGRSFKPRPQSPLQEFCSEKVCQKERRRRWQKNKRHTDPDYKDNQIRAQQTWTDANPTYWRNYRLSHPQYTDKNREQQRKRGYRQSPDVPQELISSTKKLNPTTGLYLLIDESSDVAKKDAWLIRLTVITAFKVAKNS